MIRSLRRIQNSEIEIQINFVNVQYTYLMLVDIYEF